MAEQLVQLDPAHVQADENIRFNLKKSHLQMLKASIVEHGGVLVPVSVVALETPDNGFTHRLVSGFYRHQSVSELNKEGAGMLLPAVLASPDDELDRVKQQLAENRERENMSPMDEATAIKALLDRGVDKGEVRRIFSRPNQKGVVQPASNSWVNIMLNLLELPKPIQQRIHEGSVGVGAAYLLGKVPASQRQSILDKAEAERLKIIEQEAKDEAKYLEVQRKVQEAKAEEEAAAKAVADARAEVLKAAALVTEKKEAEKAAKNIPGLAEMDEKEKKKATETLKAAMADVKAADKLKKEADNNLAKLLGQEKEAAENVLEKQEKLDTAQKLVKSKKANAKTSGASVTQKDIKKATKAAGVPGAAHVALSLQEIRDALKEAITQRSYPKAAAIFQAVQDCFVGKSTPKEMAFDVAVLIGETKPIQGVAR